MSSAIELLIAAHTALSAVPLRTLRVSCLSPPSVLVSFMDGQSLMWTPKPEPMPMPACDPGVDDSAMLGKAGRCKWEVENGMTERYTEQPLWRLLNFMSKEIYCFIWQERFPIVCFEALSTSPHAGLKMAES